MCRSSARSPAVLVLACSLAAAVPAAAEPECGAVELKFKPGAGDLQIAVWIEDSAGKVVDTPYITRLTGTFGLANRPGTPLLKSDFKWPYGRREMVLPVWAHRRGKHYPRVVMGGICGNSPQAMCPGGGLCGGECEDSTIAYHSRVSSYEPFYCSPSGASKIDALSCASKGTFAKGAYADAPAFSLYPPRADITVFQPAVDSPDLKDFAARNDLVAVSQATPPAGQLLDPSLVWFPDALMVGDYVAWIEVSREFDPNAFHDPQRHPCQADTVQAWDFEGKCWSGQPSIVYKVPFRYDGNAFSAIATSYAGYGSWDGTDGEVRPPDNTISDAPGTGAGRLLDANDGVDTFRFKVSVGGCESMDGGMPDGGFPDGGVITPPSCRAPDAPQGLALTPTSTSIDVQFASASTGFQANRFAVRYAERATPIGDSEFDTMLAGPSLSETAPGSTHSTTISGLMPRTRYAVAVRAISRCNKPSPVVSAVIETPEHVFTTLSGCFVATAAFGSPMASQVDVLRDFRDHHLVDRPAGQLFAAMYYAFGPPVARAIAGDEHLRAGARALIAPLVDAAVRIERH